MSDKKQISIIEKSVMSKIKSGQAKMRPKAYYSILSFLGLFAVIFFGFVNESVMSLVTLWLRTQVAHGPAYGVRRNLSNTIDSFPWWALLIGILSLVVAVYFMRKVGNLYKIKLSHLILIVVVASLMIGFILSYSNLPGVFNGHGPACVIIDYSNNLLNK
jgi:hypothetical protein